MGHSPFTEPVLHTTRKATLDQPCEERLPVPIEASLIIPSINNTPDSSTTSPNHGYNGSGDGRVAVAGPSWTIFGVISWIINTFLDLYDTLQRLIQLAFALLLVYGVIARVRQQQALAATNGGSTSHGKPGTLSRGKSLPAGIGSGLSSNGHATNGNDGTSSGAISPSSLTAGISSLVSFGMGTTSPSNGNGMVAGLPHDDDLDMVFTDPSRDLTTCCVCRKKLGWKEKGDKSRGWRVKHICHMCHKVSLLHFTTCLPCSLSRILTMSMFM
jgi:hypothetical protein